MNNEKRTNIVLNEKLVGKCLAITGLKNIQAVVDFASNEILRLHKQSQMLKLKGENSVEWKFRPNEAGSLISRL